MIDYQLLSSALEFYQNLGYERIEVPWMVRSTDALITTPSNRRQFLGPAGFLIGSGEQAFIEMLINGWIPRPAVCITPCFRDEPEQTSLHGSSFMKVELIRPFGEVDRILMDACEFVASLSIKYEIERTDSEIDVLIGGIEIGSYGDRSFPGHDNPGLRRGWTFGTGCAEPRMSTALKLVRACISEQLLLGSTS